MVIIQHFRDDVLSLTDHSEPWLPTVVGGKFTAYLIWAQITERNNTITLNNQAILQVQMSDNLQ